MMSSLSRGWKHENFLLADDFQESVSSRNLPCLELTAEFSSQKSELEEVVRLALKARYCTSLT